MAADFSRVTHQSAARLRRRRAQAGRRAARCRRQRARRGRRPAAARAGRRRPRPRHGVVDHARRVQASPRRRAALCDRQRAALRRRPAGREPRRGVRRPGQALFDALMAEASFADPIALRDAAVPAELHPRCRRRPAPRLPRRLAPRGHAPRSSPTLVETGGRRRHQLAPADRVAGARARPTTPAAATTCDTPDADVPGWAALIAPSDRAADAPAPSTCRRVDDPCELPPTGGYRGLENQLYRVEIHDPGQPGGTATFKWSRDNASVGSRVASIDLGHASSSSRRSAATTCCAFNSGDWVEITDDVREFSQRRRRDAPHHRRRGDAPHHVHARAAGGHASAALPGLGFPRERNLRVRRWDQTARGASHRSGRQRHDRVPGPRRGRARPA